MNDCTFNDATHEYRIGGRFVPSVTQVLGDLLPCFQAGEWYLERGRAVHACAAMIAKGIAFDHDEQIDGQVMAHGCAQAPRHDDHEKRIRTVESTMAENHGSHWGVDGEARLTSNRSR